MSENKKCKVKRVWFGDDFFGYVLQLNDAAKTEIHFSEVFGEHKADTAQRICDYINGENQ